MTGDDRLEAVRARALESERHGNVLPWVFYIETDARWLLSEVDRLRADLAAANVSAATALTQFADLIDRGPTFPLPPSVFSAMARERADDIRAEAARA